MMRATSFVAVLALALALVPAPALAAKFTLTDSDGKTHKLADYHGKWVIVNFWATWCPPCLEEIPDLVEISDAREDVKVFGVAMGYQDPQQVLQFAEGMFVNYPIVLGDEKTAKQIGKVIGLPTTFVYDPKGKLAQRFVGKVTREQVERVIGDR